MLLPLPITAAAHKEHPILPATVARRSSPPFNGGNSGNNAVRNIPSWEVPSNIAEDGTTSYGELKLRLFTSELSQLGPVDHFFKAMYHPNVAIVYTNINKIWLAATVQHQAVKPEQSQSNEQDDGSAVESVSADMKVAIKVIIEEFLRISYNF
ncbi:hypothetical protein RJT34_01399 [Clitoria ternatea]|uniref:Uncharacterized protein n=1 Tax=Clitoria ternatea TaxID=43366 RepID=A0AAN9Q3A6_CLITE